MSVVPPGEFLTESRTTDTAIDVVEEPTSSAVVSRSPGRLAWDRFRSDRKTIVAAVIVLAYIVFAVVSPILVGVGVLDPYTPHQNLLDANTLPKGFFGVSWAHPFGIEPSLGRDILSRLGYGLSFSLLIAAAASVLSVTIGVILGIVAGMNRGWADTLIGRLIDLVLSFPQTLMLLALSGVLVGFLTDTLKVPAGDPAQALFVILVLAVFGWPPVARVVRGQVLSLREREFVDAARLLGASRGRLYFREVLPNLWAPILVQFTLILPAYISAEAALSYLGISVIPPTPTLGNILKTSIQFASGDFLFFILPAFLLVLIVVSFNLLGDGLRDALDPRSNR
jgi:peptide/nickel transport system permease protein